MSDKVKRLIGIATTAHRIASIAHAPLTRRALKRESVVRHYGGGNTLEATLIAGE